MQAKPQPPGPSIQPLPFPAELPPAPGEVTKRFPKMTAWNDDMQTWWTDVRRLLAAVQSEVFNKINDNNNSSTVNNQQMADDISALNEDMDIFESLFLYQNFV